jgi:hypothetical protein
MKRALVSPAIRMRYFRDSAWSVFRRQVRGCANHRRWKLALQRHFLTLLLTAVGAFAAATRNIPTQALVMDYDALVLFPLGAEQPKRAVEDAGFSVPTLRATTSYFYEKEDTEAYSVAIQRYTSKATGKPVLLSKDKSSLEEAMGVQSDRKRGCIDRMAPMYSVDPQTTIARLEWECEGPLGTTGFYERDTLTELVHDSRVLKIMHFEVFDPKVGCTACKTDTPHQVLTSGKLK